MNTFITYVIIFLIAGVILNIVLWLNSKRLTKLNKDIELSKQEMTRYLITTMTLKLTCTIIVEMKNKAHNIDKKEIVLMLHDIFDILYYCSNFKDCRHDMTGDEIVKYFDTLIENFKQQIKEAEYESKYCRRDPGL